MSRTFRPKPLEPIARPDARRRPSAIDSAPLPKGPGQKMSLGRSGRGGSDPGGHRHDPGSMGDRPEARRATSITGQRPIRGLGGSVQIRHHRAQFQDPAGQVDQPGQSANIQAKSSAQLPTNSQPGRRAQHPAPAVRCARGFALLADAARRHITADSRAAKAGETSRNIFAGGVIVDRVAIVCGRNRRYLGNARDRADQERWKPRAWSPGPRVAGHEAFGWLPSGGHANNAKP